MNSYKRFHAWEEIHLDRLDTNIKNIKAHLKDTTKLMAVIKADAYGHGAYEIAKRAREQGVDFFGVACVEEAKQLRLKGITEPILVLGATSPLAVEDLFLYDITPTVYEKTLPLAISEYAKKNNKTKNIHIKIDTGMGRIGFCCYKRNEFDDFEDILEISKMEGIRIEGAFTHFSCADEEMGETETLSQFDNFMYAVDMMENHGISIPIKHCANSAAIALFSEMQLDMVRAGIILYGEYPSKFVESNTNLKVLPLKEMKTTVSVVKTVKRGRGISYGQNYKTLNETETLATLSVGYADSYFRGLSGKAKVLIDGHFASQVGNICMDQMVVSVDDINDVKVGDEVVLIGKSGDNAITYSDVANLMGTINYEVMCDAGKRVVKVYFDDDKFIKSVNYLEKL